MRHRRPIPFVAAVALIVAVGAAVALRLWGGDPGPIVRTLALDQEPLGVFVDGRGGRAFVLTADGPGAGFGRLQSDVRGNGRVRVFDAATGDPVTVEKAGYLPCAMVADDRAGHVLVASGDALGLSGTLFTFDAATGRRLQAVPTDAAECAASPAAAPSAGRAFFGGADDSLSAFDTRGGVLIRTTHAYDGGSVALAVDERDGRVFAALATNGTVESFDARSGRRLRIITFGGGVGAGGGRSLLIPAVDPRAGRLFVIDGTAATVDMVDPRNGAVLRAAPVVQGAAAWALDDGPGFSDGSGRLLVAGAGAVSILDTRTGSVVHTLTLGYRATRILVDPRVHRAFVFTSDNLGATPNVGVIDTRTGARVGTVALPGVPLSAALDARHGRLVVADAQGTIDIVDTRGARLVHTLPAVPSNMTAVALDEATGRAFVAHGHGLVAVPDRWAWLPAWLRSRLPFVPRPEAPYRDMPAGITVVDDTR